MFAYGQILEENMEKCEAATLLLWWYYEKNMFYLKLSLIMLIE